MRSFNVLLIGVVVVPIFFAAGAGLAASLDDADTWSETTNGLQARITLVEKSKINGTRSLVPYLELRNVGDSANPLKVRCGSGQVKFELIGADGKVVRDGWSLPRSGPHADPGTIVLPHDSTIRIGMYCSNWGVPKAPAMVSTDSGAWVLRSQEKGKVFLRATITGAKADSDPDSIWHGTIVTPAVRVDWSAERQSSTTATDRAADAALVRFVSIPPEDLPEHVALVDRIQGPPILVPMTRNPQIFHDKESIKSVAKFFGLVDEGELDSVQAAVTAIYQENEPGKEIGVYGIQFNEPKAAQELLQELTKSFHKFTKDQKRPPIVRKGNLLLCLWKDDGVSESALEALHEYFEKATFEPSHRVRNAP